MRLRQRPPQSRLISIVPLIDVMLILLVFFMVTSTYLDLNMVPAVSRSDAPPPAPAPRPGAAGTLLVRLGPDGQAYVQGQRLDPPGLAAAISARLAGSPETAVVVLPSPRADVQALIRVMDTATAAGAARLSVIRLEGLP